MNESIRTKLIGLLQEIELAGEFEDTGFEHYVRDYIRKKVGDALYLLKAEVPSDDPADYCAAGEGA